MRREVVVHFPKPQSDEAVEPGVCGFLHRLRKAPGIDSRYQLRSLILFVSRQRTTVYGSLRGVVHAALRDLIFKSHLCNGIYKRNSRPHGEILYCVFIHDIDLIF